MLIVGRNGIEVGRKIVEARSEADASGEIYRFVGQLRMGLFESGITHRIEELGAPRSNGLGLLGQGQKT
jgi:hypothetical protein